MTPARAHSGYLIRVLMGSPIPQFGRAGAWPSGRVTDNAIRLVSENPLLLGSSVNRGILDSIAQAAPSTRWGLLNV